MGRKKIAIRPLTVREVAIGLGRLLMPRCWSQEDRNRNVTFLKVSAAGISDCCAFPVLNADLATAQGGAHEKGLGAVCSLSCGCAHPRLSLPRRPS